MKIASWLLLLMMVAGTAPAFAQGQPNGNTCDMTGEWSARSREDWEDRALLGTHLGDYTGLPVNDAARQLADLDRRTTAPAGICTAMSVRL